MTRLLCTADLHIGRRPSRLPSHAQALRHSTKAAWGHIVDEALRLNVHGVVLAGDVIDQDNRYFEALGPLEEGLRRLGEAEIQTFAVAGNHDFDVLPDLATSLGMPGFHLLGSGGRWSREALVVPGEDRPRLFLDGWSFARRHHDHSPFDGYTCAAAEAPLVGVLHGEPDGLPGTGYGPFPVSELERGEACIWLVGHVHKPGRHETGSGRPWLSLGSPQPLSPKESGLHGPWMVEVDPSGHVEVEQLPTATIRYESLEVDLEGVDDDARGRIHQAIREMIHRDIAGRGAVEELVCRVVLTGRTSLHRRLDSVTSAAEEDLELSVEGVTATIDRIRVATRPDLDLEALATTPTPPGVLSRLVRALDSGEDIDTVGRVLAAAQAKLEMILSSTTFAPVVNEYAELSAADAWDLRALVREEALLLIDELQAQKEEPTG